MGQSASVEVGTDDETEVYMLKPEVPSMGSLSKEDGLSRPAHLVLMVEYALPLNKLKMLAMSRDPALNVYMREHHVWERWIERDFSNSKLKISRKFFADAPNVSHRKMYIALMAINRALDSDNSISMSLKTKINLLVKLEIDGLLLKITLKVTTHLINDAEWAEELSSMLANFSRTVVGSVKGITAVVPIDDLRGNQYGVTFEGATMDVWVMIVYTLLKFGWSAVFEDPKDKTTKYYLNAPVCATCQAPTEQVCDGCATVRYCSVDCQEKHWERIHKYECESK